MRRLLRLPEVADDGLAARVKAHELSKIVTRDGHDVLVLGLEQIDELDGSDDMTAR